MPRPHPATALSGLGIEDELSFGSDEDLIADVGEIDLPVAPAPAPTVTASGKYRISAVAGQRKKNSDVGPHAVPVTAESGETEGRSVSDSTGHVQYNATKDKDKKKKGAKHLAMASLVIDPQMESVLDLSNPNKYAGSISGSSTPSIPSLTSGSTNMSTGTGRKKGGFRNALKQGLGLKKENDPVSVFKSSKQMHRVDSHSTYELSPQQSIDLSLSSYSSRRTDTTNAIHHHLTPMTTPSKGPCESISSKRASISSPPRPSPGTHQSSFPPVSNKSILNKFPDAPAAQSSASSTTTSTTHAVLLPAFPSTIPALENITILSAPVIRRTPMAGGNAQQKKFAWIGGVLVFTTFRVGDQSATGDAADSHTSTHGFPGTLTLSSESETTRTIAHLHIFPLPTPAKHQSPTKPSSASSRPSSAGAHEMERMMIKTETTAGVWGDASFGMGNGGGERKFVLRVGSGKEGGEWILEMRNAEQLREWIQHVKSTAIIVRAENEGHGPAINQAYASGHAKGDDLALELSLQPRRTSRSGSASGTNLAAARSRSTSQSRSDVHSGGGRGRGSISLPSAAGTVGRGSIPEEAPGVGLVPGPAPAARAESPILPAQDRLPALAGAPGSGTGTYPSPPLTVWTPGSVPASASRRTSIVSGGGTGSPTKWTTVGNHFTSKLPPPAGAPPSLPLPALPSPGPLSPSSQPTAAVAPMMPTPVLKQDLVVESAEKGCGEKTGGNEEREMTEAEKIMVAAQAQAKSSLEKQFVAVPALLPGPGPVTSDLALKTTAKTATLAPPPNDDAQSVYSIPSITSKSSTLGTMGTSGSRRKRGKVAVDIMSEFSETGMADYEPDDGEAINEDRPRVIRFA